MVTVYTFTRTRIYRLLPHTAHTTPVCCPTVHGYHTLHTPTRVCSVHHRAFATRLRSFYITGWVTVYVTTLPYYTPVRPTRLVTHTPCVPRFTHLCTFIGLPHRTHTRFVRTTPVGLRFTVTTFPVTVAFIRSCPLHHVGLYRYPPFTHLGSGSLDLTVGCAVRFVCAATPPDLPPTHATAFATRLR